jgi:hypothetical protein
VSRRAGRRVALAACCTAAAAACSLLNPLDEYGPPKPKRPDAATIDASIDQAAETCGVRWPSRPAKDDATGNLEIVFATDTLNVGLPAEVTTPPGFNLDGVCTCPGSPSCVPAPNSKASCDLDGGIDNAAAVLLDDFLKASQSSANATQSLAAGNHSVLIRLRRYNGGLDDADVEVSVFASNGTGVDGGDSTPPAHDGQDLWTLDRASLYGADGPPYIPKIVDQKAYVAGGTLVAVTDIPLNLSDLVITLTGGVLTAKIKKVGSSSYRLEDGRLAGRWATKDLLKALDTLKDPFASNEGLCGTSKIYQDLKSDICGAVDLMTDPKKDNTSANCDALGMTVFFTAEKAQMGGIRDEKPPLHRCGDTWTDECPAR